MRAPKQQPPVCCDPHTSRYMPQPETTAEIDAVRDALARWDADFYFPGDDPDDGRSSVADVPEYVQALWRG